MARNGDDSSTSLAPGFRFHPTDEELVSYYLKRKVCGKPFRFDAISEIEIYKAEPWDLPGLSKLKSRDLEWYFFSNLDKKHGHGSRTNRATVEGYWKTTGKDRSIQHKSHVVGMKKTLVYHRGRAPRGERTNWVMHEYRLVDEELEKAVIPQEAFVLCRIFLKSGSGPKNGEQYGAPFVEEEWDIDIDNEVATLPDEIFVTTELSAEGNDLEQNHDVEIPSEDSARPLDFYQGEGSSFVQDPKNNVENDLKPFSGVDESLCAMQGNDNKKLIDFPMQPEIEATKSNYNAQPAVSHMPSDYQPPEADFFDNIDSFDGFFLEANDLSDPIKTHSTDYKLDNQMTYYDADDDIAQYLNFETSELLDDVVVLLDQTVNKNMDLGTKTRSSISYQWPGGTNIAELASSSKQLKEEPKSKSDSNYAFIKQASRMLGSFPAPPAFASEFPTKDMEARLHAAAQSSDLFTVTGATTKDDRVLPWSFDKRGNLNVLVSFNLPLADDIVSSNGLQTLTGALSRKMTSVLSRNCFYFCFFWVLVLAISAKMGTCI
uniref:NAC domain containing transcription factor NAC8 n=1 Tax=Fagopyrum tataricum TaxID=62330 RepID=A0A385A3S9_FAGTA|nr:NAC domain containing transcription factor NAC8 [Fagopyrum tataricum]